MYLFGQTEIEYFEFWVTCKGFLHVINKIKAINNMTLPTTEKGSTQIYRFSKIISWNVIRTLEQVTTLN